MSSAEPQQAASQRDNIIIGLLLKDFKDYEV